MIATLLAAAALTPAQIAEVGVAPPPAARLPAGLPFVDQAGQSVRLAPAGVPTVLLFADFTCRHICGPGVTLTAGALHDAGLAAPKDYRLVVIGLDGDGPAAARAFLASHLGPLPDVARTVEVLTGSPATVAAAERAFGYRAVYDPVNDQFAHDAASFVLAPDGRLARVLPETAVTPAMIRGAIADAAQGRRASAFEQIVSVCYGFAAAHGLYGRALVTALRVLGLLTLAGIGLALWRLARRGRAVA